LDSMNQALAIAQASVRAGQQGADLVPILLTYRSELQQQMGRIDDAVADANQALALIQEAAQPGTSSVLAGHARLALGRAFQAQQKNDRARANFQMAAEQLEQSLGRDNAETVAARRSAQ